MARLSSLRHRDRQGATIAIEILDLQVGQFAIPCASFEGRLNEPSEVWLASIDQPLGLRNRQITYTGCVCVLEWLDRSPFIVRGHLLALIAPCSIKGSLQDGQCAVSGRAATAKRLGVLVRVAVILSLAFLCAQAWWLLGQRHMPFADLVTGELIDFDVTKLRLDECLVPNAGVLARFPVCIQEVEIILDCAGYGERL